MLYLFKNLEKNDKLCIKFNSSSMKSAIRIPDTMLTEMKRNAYEAVKKKGFEHSGTIFGGFVRDEFISEYYSAKFNREYNDTSKYWDPKHMPETKNRILIPNDMDISFKNEDEANVFIDAIKQIREFHEVHVTDMTYNANPYSDMQNVLQSVKRIFIYMRVGHIPFKRNGLIISIHIDVVVPNNPELQPPFNNLDVLCNGFIMTKEGGKQFSRNTGTIIDKYSDYERAVVIPQIIKDMHQFRSYICMTTTSNADKRRINIIALKRVRKLLMKKTPWTMINLPFKKETFVEPTDSSEKTDCCICLQTLETNDEVAYTTIQKEDGTEIPSGKLHYGCMLQCLHNQAYSPRLDNDHNGGVFTFTCPFRNKITFTRCKLDIQFAYKTDL